MTSESYSHHDCSTLRTCNGVFTCNITVFNLRTGHPRATPILRETTGIPVLISSKLNGTAAGPCDTTLLRAEYS